MELCLEAAEAEVVRAAARALGVTPFAAVAAAFAVLLHRLTGEDDVVVGVPTSVRPHPAVQRTVGYFIRTLPLRVRLSARDTLADTVRAVARSLREGLDHAEVSPGWRGATAGGEAGRAGPPFRTLLTWRDTPPFRGSMGGLQASEFELDLGGAALDLTFSLGDGASEGDGPCGMEGFAEFRTPHHDAAQMARWVGAFRRILAALAEPGVSLDSIALLPEHEARALVESVYAGSTLPARPERERSGKAAPPGLGFASVLDRIDEAARRTPRAWAVRSSESGGLTYEELDASARYVAEQLGACGVLPGERVLLDAAPLPSMIAGILGILRAGAAYVPIDPAYPEARRLAMARESGARWRVPVPDGVRASGARAPIAVVAGRSGRRASGATDAAGGEGPADLAYLIFTSGSTGLPKAVQVTHANLVASTEARFAFYGEPVERYLLLSSPSFDSSVAGIFWTLASGGTLLLPSADRVRDASALAAFAAIERPTHLLALPSLYALLLERDTFVEGMEELRVAIAAGEALPAALVSRHRARLPHAALYNEYGPTEGTVWCTVHRCGPSDEVDPVPIGRPIPGYRTYVADPAGYPLPPDFPGELCVAGPGVAAGYRGRDRETAERFVRDPWAASPDERMYRTGDRVRLGGDGVLRFLGRLDRQVKVRGHRIELEEIEVLLTGHPEVHEAVAAVGGTSGRGEALTVWASVGPAASGPGAAALRQRVRGFLADHLPRAIRPDAVFLLAEFPRTPNGKVDRDALPTEEPTPEPAAGRARPHSDPDSRSEGPDAGDDDPPELGWTVNAWSELLGGARVVPDDDFFALGGNSLDAIRLQARAEDELGIHIDVAAIFDATSARDFAQALVRAGTSPKVRPTG